MYSRHTYQASNSRAAQKPDRKADSKLRQIQFTTKSPQQVVSSLSTVVPAPKKEEAREVDLSQLDKALVEPKWSLQDVIPYISTCCENQPDEHTFWITPDMIEGQFPHDLQGTFYRNGPGLMQNGDYTVDHSFDGDGLMTSLAFEKGRAFFRSKFVHTKEFVEERKQGRALYRGAFTRGNPSGLLFNPFDFTSKNVANTGVFAWGKRLFALYESGLPYEMDADSLLTQGESRLDGSFQSEVCQAHYRRVVDSSGQERYVTFGIDKKGMDVVVSFYEYSEEGTLLQQRKVAIPNGALAMFHDLAVTDNYYILYKNPTKLDVGKLLSQYMLGRAGLAECILHDTTKPALVLVIPRKGPHMTIKPNEVIQLETQPRFVFHHFNAFEVSVKGTPHVVLDCCTWQKLDFARTGRLGELNDAYYNDGSNLYKPSRIVCNLQARTALMTDIGSHNGDFPTINQLYTGKAHRHMYYAGTYARGVHGPTQAIVKMSMEPRNGVGHAFDREEVEQQVWRVGRRKFIAEVSLVRKADGVQEDDCWVIGYVHDAEKMRAEFVILDAKKVNQGPVAVIKLPIYLPMGLHSCWSRGVAMEQQDEMIPPGQIITRNIHQQAF